MNDLFGPEQLAPEAITLSEFNRRIAKAINGQPDILNQWIQAETGDVHVVRGHCYLELIEKDPESGNTVAKINAVIWASTFAALGARFHIATGSEFTAGIKVMVCVNANFHGQYGLKAVITDINPEYTLGDIARRRREILERLTREGIIDMNRSLEMPMVPQRIAVVSAKGAAGFGDFVDQLHRNPRHIAFTTTLFSASMQGERTAPTIIAALEAICERVDDFDCVVIIRGGGSTSDLNWFDNYDLAAAVAQFPLPVVIGIGHERDTTVLDHVAWLRVKTPTAAAEWLIEQGDNLLNRLNQLSADIAANVREIVKQAQNQLNYLAGIIPANALRIVDAGRHYIQHIQHHLPILAGMRIEAETHRLGRNEDAVRAIVDKALLREHLRIDALADKQRLLSPQNTLNRGYALIERDGHFTTSARQLAPGQDVTITLADGKARATITTSETND